MISYQNYLRKRTEVVLAEYFKSTGESVGNIFSQGALNKFLRYNESLLPQPERINTKSNGNPKEPDIHFLWTDENKTDVRIRGLARAELHTTIGSKSILQFLKGKTAPRRPEVVLVAAKLFNASTLSEFLLLDRQGKEKILAEMASGSEIFVARKDWRYWVNAAEKMPEIRNRIDLYLEALVEIPNDFQIVKNLGVTLYDAGRYEEAEKYFQLGIKIAPKEADIHSNYGLFLHEIRRNYHDAEKHFNKALKLVPMHKDCNSHYAWFLHTIRNNLLKAEKYYRLALKINPNNSTALGNYGWLLCFQKFEPQKGIEHLEKSLRLSPGHAAYIGAIAFANSTYQLDYKRAEKLFKKSLELAPTSYVKSGNYAQLLFVLGRKKEAMGYVEIARKYGSADSGFLLELEYYIYAHCFEVMDVAEQKIKLLLSQGVTSEMKNFSINIKAAMENEHPDPVSLIRYASLISKMKYDKTGSMIIPAIR